MSGTIVTVIFIIFVSGILCLGCGGSNNDTNGERTTSPNKTSSVLGSTILLKDDSTNVNKAFNSYASVPIASDGAFTIPVSQATPTVTYTVSNTGNKILAALTTDSQDPLRMDAQSTAEVLVLLNPLLIPDNQEEYSDITNVVRSNTKVKELAMIIENIYTSNEDPLSDDNIIDTLSGAVSDAVISILEDLENSQILARYYKAQPYREFARYSSSSDIQIQPYDMAALTIGNSLDSTLKLELNYAGPFGIKTNVSWLANIVELDPSKISGFNGDLNYFSRYTYNHIQEYIKENGFQKQIIVKGEIASGCLGFVIDPVGKLADSLASTIMPNNGIKLEHGGVYAIVAYSGSSYGDDEEYNAIINNTWQKSRWEYARCLNIILGSLDTLGVLCDLKLVSVLCHVTS